MLFDEITKKPYYSLSSKSLPGVDIWVEYPDSDLALIRVFGDLDAVTTPQLAELLAPRLRSAVDAVVLDLSQVSFLCTQAMHLLVEAEQHADVSGVAFRLVTGPPAVDRALRAAGLTHRFDRYSALGLALREPARR